jgi:hypothetical protein
MTGYRKAHGDLAAIDLDISNDYGAYKESQRIFDVAWWDDDDNTWNDVTKSAKLLRQFVSELDTSQPEFGDIAGIDFAGVNWEALVIAELQERNLQDGRPMDAGLA